VTEKNIKKYKSDVNVMEKIKLKYYRLSKSQKMIANYILNHYDKVAFMTASILGETVNVSESTVVRFANALGYSGYPKLQKALQELIKTKLTTVQRLEISNRQITQESIIEDVIKSDIDNIQAIINELDREEFSKIAEVINRARNIYIIGFRTSTILAEFLGFYLNLILDNVRVVRHGVSDIYEQLIHITKEDIIIGISFPRYSSKTTQILKFVKEKDAKIIAITDSDLSPLIELSDYKLIARSNMVSFVDSLVVPLSLMNALIVSIGMGKREYITKKFEDLESIWERYEIYTNKVE
jgi:DNA-binding MurR/RpiR family transcriptional regulator